MQLRSIKTVFWLVAVLVIASLILIACGAAATATPTKAPAAAPTTPPAPAAQPTAVPAAAGPSGKMTMVIGNEPASFDVGLKDDGNLRPIANQVYERLIALDNSAKMIPELAEKWELQSDPTKWRFTLRKGVKFHDGEDFNADDVVFSVKRAIDPNFKSEWLGNWETIKDAVKVDDFTVDIVTAAPDPVLLNRMLVFWMMPDKWTKAAGDKVHSEANGTGPYKLTSWARGQKIMMTSNAAWWGGEKNLAFKDLEVQFREEPAVRLGMVKAGEAQFARNIPPDLAKEAPKTTTIAPFEVAFVRINEKFCDVLKDVKVRQALNHAIDRKGLADKLFLGLAALPQGQLFSKGIPGFNNSITDYPYDVAKAKALVKEAGAEGKSIEFVMPSGRWTKDKELFETAAAMMSESGVKVVPKVVEWSKWLDALYAIGAAGKEKEAPCLQGSYHSNEMMIPDRTYTNLVYSKGRMSGISDPDLDKQIEALRTEMDAAKRAKGYEDLGKMTHDRARFSIPLVSPNLTQAISKNIDWPWNPADEVFVKYVKKTS